MYHRFDAAPSCHEYCECTAHSPDRQQAAVNAYRTQKITTRDLKKYLSSISAFQLVDVIEITRKLLDHILHTLSQNLTLSLEEVKETYE